MKGVQQKPLKAPRKLTASRIFLRRTSFSSITIKMNALWTLPFIYTQSLLLQGKSLYSIHVNTVLRRMMNKSLKTDFYSVMAFNEGVGL